MRILDQVSDKSLSDILLLLTIAEARELKDDLEMLIIQKNKNDHVHLNDENFTKEITVSIYDPAILNDFNDRVQKLIIEDM